LESRSGRSRNERGFVLIIVLWTVGLLALIGNVLVANARQEAQLTTTLRDQSVGRAAADGVLSETIMDILKGIKTVSGQRQFANVPIELTVRDLSGRLNPNIAPNATIKAVLAQIGVPVDRAKRLAAAIVDWRTPGLAPTALGTKADQYVAAGFSYGPPGAPFETLDELGLVLGMDATVLAALKPHLTLWSTNPPDPAVADEIIRGALRAVGAPLSAVPTTEARVIELTAVADLPAHVVATRRAVVRFGPSADSRGWRILAWDDGDRADAAGPN